MNITPGKFGKNNKCSPIYTLYFYYLNRLYEVRNKAKAPGKKSKIDKRRGTFILDSRVLKTGSPTYTVSYKISRSCTSGVVIIES